MEITTMNQTEAHAMSFVQQESLKNAVMRYLKTKTTGLNAMQREEFLAVCLANGLNPLMREAYAVVYKGQMSILTGYEYYIKRAERTGKLAGWNVRIQGQGRETEAVITIYRKDWDRPFEHTVEMGEYYADNNMWRSKPKTMLKKVAIAQGFRLCFSDAAGGLPYATEEMEQETHGIAEVEIEVEPQPAQPAQSAPQVAQATQQSAPQAQAPKTKSFQETMQENQEAVDFEEYSKSVRHGLAQKLKVLGLDEQQMEGFSDMFNLRLNFNTVELFYKDDEKLKAAIVQFIAEDTAAATRME